MTRIWLSYLPILLAGAAALAQESKNQPIACNPKAIRAVDRPRYGELTKRLGSAVEGRSELADGYALRLNDQKMGLPEVAEWIAFERLCCPFLTFRLSVAGNQSGWTLELTGPEGVKQILEAEFSHR